MCIERHTKIETTQRQENAKKGFPPFTFENNKENQVDQTQQLLLSALLWLWFPGQALKVKERRERERLMHEILGLGFQTALGCPFLPKVLPWPCLSLVRKCERRRDCFVSFSFSFCVKLCALNTLVSHSYCSLLRLSFGAAREAVKDLWCTSVEF